MPCEPANPDFFAVSRVSSLNFIAMGGKVSGKKKQAKRGDNVMFDYLEFYPNFDPF